MGATGRQADIRYGGRASDVTTAVWLTPAPLRHAIERRWSLTFDPCPYPRPEWDGLSIPWTEPAFVNPPYGRETGRWLAKALSEIHAGRCPCAVFLIHARTDTRWFHRYVLARAYELYFLRGRVAFVRPDGSSASSPFPSLLAVFRQGAPIGGDGPKLHTFDHSTQRGVIQTPSPLTDDRGSGGNAADNAERVGRTVRERRHTV